MRCAGSQGSGKTTPVLELQDLHVLLCTHRHQGVELVKEVSFSVYPGECLGVLEESGSGKSMSMKAAVGPLDHSFRVLGGVRSRGEELLERSDEGLCRLRNSQIGIILQSPTTCSDPLYRIGAQVAETSAAHDDWNKADIRQHSLEMLEKVRAHNPKEVLEKYPHRLSGGMLQRIMIGIVTSMESSLLIADEPTTTIDVITQSGVPDELLRIKQEHQAAIVFISHDSDTISRMTDRIVILNQGFVVDQDDFQHILYHAAGSYTKLLVEERTDVTHRYNQMLGGKKRVHA